MKLQHYFYLGLFCSSSYEMFEFYGGKVPLEACIGITALVLVVTGFVFYNLIRTGEWFMEHFFK